MGSQGWGAGACPMWVQARSAAIMLRDPRPAIHPLLASMSPRTKDRTRRSTSQKFAPCRETVCPWRVGVCKDSF